MKKNLIIIGGLILLLLALGAFIMFKKTGKIIPKAATGSPTISLNPSQSTVNINDTLKVDIELNTDGVDVAGAQIAYLNYDTSVFDVQDEDPAADGIQIAKGNLIGTDTNQFDIVIANNVDSSQGKISFSVGSFTKNINTSGVLATINFIPKKNITNTPVTFDFTPDSKTQTMVGEPGTGSNILSSVLDGLYTVGEPNISDATVDLKVNNSNGPVVINAGQTVDLSWTSTNATTCEATQGWSGTKSTSGTETSSQLSIATTFVLTCSGSGNPGTDEVIVNIQSSENPPTVDIKANDTAGAITIEAGTSATLSWASTNATTCQASGHWSGEKDLSGTESTGNIGSSKQYILTCQGDGGTTADNVRVIVKSSDGDVVPADPPTVDEPVFSDTQDNTTSQDNTQSSSTTTQTSNEPAVEVPQQEVAKVPDNIQPPKTTVSTTKTTTNSQTLTKGDTIKSWQLLIYAILIPATIAGTTVYFLIRKRKNKSNPDSENKITPNNIT